METTLPMQLRVMGLVADQDNCCEQTDRMASLTTVKSIVIGRNSAGNISDGSSEEISMK